MTSNRSYRSKNLQYSPSTEHGERVQRLDCCRLLLSLSVSPIEPDLQGRVPIVIAALRSDEISLSLLRQMLVSLTVAATVFPSSATTDTAAGISKYTPLDISTNFFKTTIDTATASSSAYGIHTDAAPIIKEKGKMNINSASLPSELLANEHIKYLLWHVLMACPERDTTSSPIPSSSSSFSSANILGKVEEEEDDIGENFTRVLKLFKSKAKASICRQVREEQESRHRGHEKCVEVLLRYGFPGKNNREERSGKTIKEEKGILGMER